MEGSTVLTRRKIRKGTQSCWECKRRKTRCTFSTASEAICDGCRSRRTKCISQEFCDEAAKISKSSRLDETQLSFEQLQEQSIPGKAVTQASDLSDSHQQRPLRLADNGGNGEKLPSSRPFISTDITLESHVTGRLDQISAALTELWPTQDDLDLILSVPLGISVLYHGAVCAPYSSFFAKQIPSPHSELQLPSRGSHPVIIARRLLMLSIFLQGIPPTFSRRLLKMTCNYRTLMSRIVDTVGRLVTSNDELVNSLEGVECIMIESMYRNNAGNLRRAWLTNRRAMNVYQLMGLNAGKVSITSRKILDEDTRSRIHPNYMWFRLVCSDRYLSLVLGLPQCSVENIFASARALECCTPLERLERLESVACGLILQRNSAERPDLAETQRIDELLQEAAALMPPQWWMMTPDLGVLASNDVTAFEETIRLTYQFTHHHLLLQLHLPYLLQPPSTNPQYEYNKLNAANASRTILTQFLYFRRSTSFVSYCRGIDFIVFIAGTTLCLAHIEARRQDKLVAGVGHTILQTLRHQRQNDRGLLECILETLSTMVQSNKDPVASEVTRILQPLLDIESDSAKGQCYEASASLGAGKVESQGDIYMDKVQNLLRIHIPHFGTIKIEPHHPTRNNNQVESSSGEQMELDSRIHRVDFPGMPDSEPPHPSNRMEYSLQQRIEVADNSTVHSVQPNDIDWPAVLTNFEPESQLHVSPPERLNQSQSNFDTTNGTQNTDFLPDFDYGVEEWPLQSVDTALFNNLLQGYIHSSEER